VAVTVVVALSLRPCAASRPVLLVRCCVTGWLCGLAALLAWALATLRSSIYIHGDRSTH